MESPPKEVHTSSHQMATGYSGHTNEVNLQAWGCSWRAWAQKVSSESQARKRAGLACSRYYQTGPDFALQVAF
eukprot:1147699-Pelagomonas_calceolata.AAC.6